MKLIINTSQLPERVGGMKNAVDLLATAGFDGIELGRYYTPSITTVRQPAETLAEGTVSLLFEIIAGRKTHQHLVYDAEFLERESTKKN